MPRILRTDMNYPYYHIISRGNQKQAIFKKEDDFAVYLALLKKAKRKYQILIHSYCLMPNHVHMLIKTESSSNMSKFMQWINRGYAAHFNVTYEKTGHLWQGRFISKPILKEKYLLDCVNYIETNPIRADIIKDMANYQWSSYKERYLLPEKFLLDDMIFT